MKSLNIEVEGMNCNGCVKKISNHFNEIANVTETLVSLEKQTIELTGEDDLSNMKVRNDLIELGFNVKSIRKA